MSAMEGLPPLGDPGTPERRAYAQAYVDTHPDDLKRIVAIREDLEELSGTDLHVFGVPLLDLVLPDDLHELIRSKLAQVDVEGDLLTQLRRVNQERRDRWHTPDTIPWSGADWGNAMAGEAGEACNVVKKLRRHETGTHGATDPSVLELVDKLAAELADTIIYVDLLAWHYGIDLVGAIVAKFNLVSVREGFPDRLADPRPTP